MRVRVFRREGNNQYYFQFLRDDGQVILNSEGYTAEAARDNGVQSVINNANNAANYERRTTADGRHQFILKAANGQEIGRSVTFRNEDSREAAITLLQNEGASVQDGAARAAGEEKPYEASGNEDNYKPLAFYEARITGVDDGFDSFSEGEQHYFTYNLGGNVYLISEGYTSIAARDNGITSVIANMAQEDRYQREVHPNGKHYFNLRAGNNKEIATSRWFDSEGEMSSIIARIIAGVGLGGQKVEEGTELEAANRTAKIVIAAPPPPKEEEPKKKRKRRTGPKKPKAEKVYVANGNYLFNDITWDIFRSGNGRYYFTFKNKEGKTLFLNSDVRGFETQEEAQAVIDQIMLYAPYEANFDGKMARNGKYYFYIKGEDGKNIGKSFFYDSEANMQESVGLLLGSEVERAAAAARRAVIDDYMPCAAYAGADGFYKFQQAESGEYYFAYNHDGKTYLRSEGYTTESARDNGIESVIKNAPLDERWRTLKDENDGRWYYALRAGNNQEIARSCGYNSEAAMTTAWGWLRGEESTIGKGAKLIDGVWYSGYWLRKKREEEAAAKKQAAALAAAAASKEIDNYLNCSEYLANENGFHRFYNEEDGEYYFSYIHDGKVYLRSEGYTTVKARDNGIESVIKNSPIEKRWKTFKDEDDGRWYYALRAGNNQEIARSCGYNSEGAMLAGWGWFKKREEHEAAAAAAALALKKEEAAAVVAPVVIKEEPEVVTVVKKEDDDSIWKWLLPLLALLALGLLFMWLRSCGSENAAPPPPPPPKAAAVPPIVPPARPACNCGANDYYVMDLSSDRTPIELTRLGTNPEFGNSHGFSGYKFLGKLRNRYATDNTHKKFLDDLFVAMGYTNGFADAKATMFSEVTIPNGKTGNMGYGAHHGTSYMTLNAASPEDLQAYKIEAANGCDVHFMKTCGNHFFFCPN